MLNNDLGFYLKTVRIFNGITKKTICEQCNIKTQYLTKLENNTEATFIENRKKEELLMALIKKPKLNQTTLQRNMNLVNEFFESFIEGDQKNMKRVLDLLQQDRTLCSSSCFSYFVFVKLIAGIEFNNIDYEFEVYYDVASKTYTHLNDEMKALYFVAVGKYERSSLNKEKEYYFKKALSYTNDEKICGLIYYYCCLNDLSIGRNIQAFNHIKNASDIFQKSNMYIRYASTISVLALIYVVMNEFNEAIRIFNQSIKCAKMLNLNQVLAESYENMACGYMLMEKYEDVDKYCLEAIKYKSDNKLIYFYNSYSLYKLNQNKRCNEWIEKGLKSGRVDNDLIKLLNIMKVLNNKHKNAIVLLEKFVLHKNKHINSINAKLLCKELVKFKRDQKMFKEALFYLECIGK